MRTSTSIRTPPDHEFDILSLCHLCHDIGEARCPDRPAKYSVSNDGQHVFTDEPVLSPKESTQTCTRPGIGVHVIHIREDVTNLLSGLGQTEVVAIIEPGEAVRRRCGHTFVVTLVQIGHANVIGKRYNRTEAEVQHRRRSRPDERTVFSDPVSIVGEVVDGGAEPLHHPAGINRRDCLRAGTKKSLIRSPSRKQG